ncbi:hypothetical protein O987_24020 [Comamonas testosteroni TK102]|uniref:Uncharacterized protein n=1 Tax=Comamonas testosteroni TK102 TaxID=1392005 RepID=A0A076PVZ2_COMTE|nr:hypothetical protein [Comamonas testosteroni]AIJ48881.1 hypothetical protein O987_24020 [Comamonas testosteroni TK102]
MTLAEQTTYISDFAPLPVAPAPTGVATRILLGYKVSYMHAAATQVLKKKFSTPFAEQQTQEVNTMAKTVFTPNIAKKFGITKDIDRFADELGVEYLFVSDEAVRTGSATAAGQFNADKPAAIAALFPEDAGTLQLAEFREKVADVLRRFNIAFTPRVVDICALPDEILVTCVHH